MSDNFAEGEADPEDVRPAVQRVETERTDDREAEDLPEGAENVPDDETDEVVEEEMAEADQREGSARKSPTRTTTATNRRSRARAAPPHPYEDGKARHFYHTIRPMQTAQVGN